MELKNSHVLIFRCDVPNIESGFPEAPGIPTVLPKAKGLV